MQKRSYFITGTDTGVGKTVVTTALLLAMQEAGRDAIPMKPVQTGCDEVDGGSVAPDLEWALRHAGLEPTDEERGLMCPYRFALPASPHLAAGNAGREIDTQVILDAFEALQSRHESVLVEGAGGLLVPLNSETTMLHLVKALDLPTIVVARARLGTLNHSLLTLQRLQAEAVPVAGLVMVDAENKDWGLIEEDNVETLKQLSGAPFLGTIPFIPNLEQNRSKLLEYGSILLNRLPTRNPTPET